MGKIVLDVWVCDQCAHSWLMSEAYPTHCASSKCRSRKWNKNAGAGTVSGNLGNDVKSPAEAKEPRPAPKPEQPSSHDPKTCRVYKCGMCEANVARSEIEEGK